MAKSDIEKKAERLAERADRASRHDEAARQKKRNDEVKADLAAHEQEDAEQ